MPVAPTPEMLERARAALPELPAARAERFESELGLNADTAKLLAFRSELGDLYEEALSTDGVDPKTLANWVTQESAAAEVEPGALAKLVSMVSEKTVSAAAARQVLGVLAAEGGDPAEIVEREGLTAQGGGRAGRHRRQGDRRERRRGREDQGRQGPGDRGDRGRRDARDEGPRGRRRGAETDPCKTEPLVRVALLLLLGAAIAAVPSPALALTNAERKAMDAKSIDAASTPKSGFAEIRFGGPVGDRLGRGDLRNGKVKVRFIPASGKATTITESGPSRAPKTRRRGTKGDFDVARDGRRLLVFARNLRAPAARVVVTTKAPPKLDTLRAQPPFLDLESELELELEQTDRQTVAAQTRLSNAELKVADTSAKVKRLERA